MKDLKKSTKIQFASLEAEWRTDWKRKEWKQREQLGSYCTS